jgi:hypothetical protein
MITCDKGHPPPATYAKIQSRWHYESRIYYAEWSLCWNEKIGYIEATSYWTYHKKERRQVEELSDFPWSSQCWNPKDSESVTWVGIQKRERKVQEEDWVCVWRGKGSRGLEGAAAQAPKLTLTQGEHTESRSLVEKEEGNMYSFQARVEMVDQAGRRMVTKFHVSLHTGLSITWEY